MKPLIQKIPLGEEHSFLARTFSTPDFEVGWHQHVEVELILLKEGSGLAFIGNDVGHWEAGDVYLLGSGLPHSFQKSDPDGYASAMVVQFHPDFWGESFLRLAENEAIRGLLAEAMAGLKVGGKSTQILGRLITDLEYAQRTGRIIGLLRCLHEIAHYAELSSVSTMDTQATGSKHQDKVKLVFDFTMANFGETITLAEVADMACMSVPAFCNWFKKSTKKTYVDFLNEIRIGYACRLLLSSKVTIPEIGYDSGYNTAANFHKQFLKVKGLSPLQYRKQFNETLNNTQNNIHVLNS